MGFRLYGNFLPVQGQPGASTRFVPEADARVEVAESIRERFGAAISARRELVDLTQEKAAGDAGISVRTWRDLESGKAYLSFDTIEKVIEALDWSWDEVLPVVFPTRSDSETPAEAQRLFDQAWRRATARERELLLAGLKVLAGSRRSRSPSR